TTSKERKGGSGPMKWEEFKEQLMKNPAFRKEYEDLEPEYQLVRSIIQQRIAKGMTQAELAKRVGTRQSAIARLESGRYNPSLRFLKKVAKALDAKLEVRLKTQ
ncbi:MAG: helix-turn-helix transcriptional regulator, partial [Moorellaceae bacterium]